MFDLLGELYTMPIEGSRLRETGDADHQRRGVRHAAAIQSRMGSRSRSLAIAAGCSTCGWPMPMASTRVRSRKSSVGGSTARAWSPDGQYIYARRHFVGERSLGAGEVWMFHVSGSEGVQVTERASIQKDAGEPALSPDGKTLYYSRDVSPGPNFDYNRDPNGVIYAIYARDLSPAVSEWSLAGRADRSRRACRRTASSSRLSAACG